MHHRLHGTPPVSFDRRAYTGIRTGARLMASGKRTEHRQPLAQILSAAMLFEYFNLTEEGKLIREAVKASLNAEVRTPEIQVKGGDRYGTKEVGEWIVNYIEKA